MLYVCIVLVYTPTSMINMIFRMHPVVPEIGESSFLWRKMATASGEYMLQLHIVFIYTLKTYELTYMVVNFFHTKPQNVMNFI